jgi:hypothetical protein
MTRFDSGLTAARPPSLPTYPTKKSIPTPPTEGANGETPRKFLVCKPHKTHFFAFWACTVSYGLPYGLLC